jgi:hypothetical protein
MDIGSGLPDGIAQERIHPRANILQNSGWGGHDNILPDCMTERMGQNPNAGQARPLNRTT